MADGLEITDALESLAVICRPPIMDVEARSRWVQTWCEDLSEFPIEAIRAACREWRQGAKAKFPTPGQLLPLIRAALPKQESVSAPDIPWYWPTERELEAMSLREQRRQNLIMADVTRSKAGPMNDDGVTPQPEWIDQAKVYTNKAKRLQGLISRGASHSVGIAA